MRITRITTNPDRVSRKVLLDTDRLKEKAKDVWKRIGEVNDVIDNKIDQTVGKIVDLFG